MSEQTANTQPENQQQQMRPPQIDGPLLVLMNRLNEFLGKANMTRTEHQEADRLIQTLLMRLESDQKEIRNLSERLEKLLNEKKTAKPVDSGNVVDAVLNELDATKKK